MRLIHMPLDFKLRQHVIDKHIIQDMPIATGPHQDR
jgi:hypothetical protein